MFYNSLFLRFLWTGEEGSRFKSSGGKSFPWESNQARSSRIFLLFARSVREEPGAIRKIIRIKKSQEACRETMLLTGDDRKSMKTRPFMKDRSNYEKLKENDSSAIFS